MRYSASRRVLFAAACICYGCISAAGEQADGCSDSHAEGCSTSGVDDPVNEVRLLQSRVALGDAGAEKGEIPVKQLPEAADQDTAEKGENNKQITFVLCSSVDDGEGIPRLPGLLASLAAFAEPGLIHELLVVVPDKDYDIFSDSLERNGNKLWNMIKDKAGDTEGEFLTFWKRNGSFPVRMLGDSEVLPTPVQALYNEVPEAEKSSSGGRGAHYRVQMMVKLAIAKFVKTPFYVTLDNDIFAKRRFGYNDLVSKSGKALIQGDTILTSSQHREGWWECADRALKANGCAHERDLSIGVTPSVMSTLVNLEMINRVYTVHGQGAPFDLLLFRLLKDGCDWTEYTLHWTAACATGLRNDFFDSSRTILYEESGFQYENYDQNKMQASFYNGAVFGVQQSISGVDVRIINSGMLPLITRSGDFNMPL